MALYYGTDCIALETLKASQQQEVKKDEKKSISGIEDVVLNELIRRGIGCVINSQAGSRFPGIKNRLCLCSYWIAFLDLITATHKKRNSAGKAKGCRCSHPRRLNTDQERRQSKSSCPHPAAARIPARPESTKMDDAQRASNWAHSAQTSLGPG